MKKKVVVLIVVLLVVLGAGASLYSLLGDSVSPGAGSADTASASAAPALKVYDEEGNPVTLEDLKGKPTVINFWASWCGPCKSEMAGFNEMYLELGDQVNFAMINLTDGSRETRENALSYIYEQGYSFPVYFDLDMTASMDYEAYSIPLTYFLDAEGNIVSHINGAMDKETLQNEIDKIVE